MNRHVAVLTIQTRMRFIFSLLFQFSPVFRALMQRPRFRIVLCRDEILGHMNEYMRETAKK